VGQTVEQAVQCFLAVVDGRTFIAGERIAAAILCKLTLTSTSWALLIVSE
jgi:hypothetical protein